ncbi:MAG: cadherin-like beta sandwich domain-containing protein, partial [Gammaproteobacteria bacterium]|nr:cadherin-like beta sandwich domain-containing protein [Gammaproteobacteria bacterium]
LRDLDFTTSTSYRGELGDVAKEWTTDVDGDGRYGWHGLSEFAATLDGNGHSIANMTQKKVSRVGLIYSTTSSAVEIKGLGLIDIDIDASADASKHAGGLISNLGGATTVSSSYVTGTINLSGNNAVVGGLIAMTGESGQATEIDRCHADVVITGNGNAVGGLVGILNNKSRIRHSQAHGRVMGDSDRVGALVGLMHGTVENSYATAQVTGGDKTGGLVGEGSATATIRNSYARGNATGADAVGGLVGLMSGTVEDSYAIGKVVGRGSVGGLVADLSDGNILRSYWATDLSGLNYSGGFSSDYLNYRGVTSAALQTATTTSTKIGAVYYNWNSNNWDFGTTADYPALRYYDDSCGSAEASPDCGKLLLYQRIGLRDLAVIQNVGDTRQRLEFDFDADTLDYMLTIDTTADYLTVVPTATNADADIIVSADGVRISADGLNYDIALGDSDPIIIIEVAAQTTVGREQAIAYKLTVNRRPEIASLEAPTSINEGETMVVNASIHAIGAVDYSWHAGSGDASIRIANILNADQRSGQLAKNENSIALSFAVPTDFVAAADANTDATMILTLSDGTETISEQIMFRIRKRNNGAIHSATPKIVGSAYVIPAADLSSDPDGEGDESGIRYQWQRRYLGVWSDIAGATASSYSLGGIIGDSYRVLTSYTDGQGYAERIVSASVAPIGDDYIDSSNRIVMDLPDFDEATTRYTVANDKDSVNVIVSADSDEQVYVNGTLLSGHTTDIALAVGDNIIEVRWVTDDDETDLYKATVTRRYEPQLKSLSLLGGGDERIFAVSADGYVTATTYTVSFSDTADSITITAAAGVGTTITVVGLEGTRIFNDTVQTSVQLHFGDNIVKVITASADGQTYTYSLMVTRSYKAELTSLNITPISGRPFNFSSQTYSYFVNVADTTEAVRITAAAGVGTTIKITAADGTLHDFGTTADKQFDVAFGSNIINIEVTAASGTSLNYTLNITRPYSRYLQSLALTGIDKVFPRDG